MKIHFIGAGGAGMYPLSCYCLQKGQLVSGSDRNFNENVKRLQNKGATVFNGHRAENVKGVDLIVYSHAVQADNVELCAGKSQKIPCVTRERFLGFLFNSFNSSYAVCGAHGKTTTALLLAHTLRFCNQSTIEFIGGELQETPQYSAQNGKETVVAEACEYMDSFLTLNPQNAICLNTDYDHTDYFKTDKQLIKSYNRFFAQCKKSLFLSADVDAVLKHVKAEVLRFGINGNFDYNAKNVVLRKDGATFDLFEGHNFLSQVKSKLLGEHNVKNALAVFACCHYNKIPLSKTVEAVESFEGVKRRWESIDNNYAKVVEDYAHHPKQVEATLRCAKSQLCEKIYVFFQPHTYSRTKAFFEEFSQSFFGADYVGILPVYSAREGKTEEGYSAEDLTERVKEKGVNAEYLENFESVANVIKTKCTRKDLVLLLGAGDIYRIRELLT